MSIAQKNVFREKAFINLGPWSFQKNLGPW